MALGQLEIVARVQPELVAPLAGRLYRDALRMDLPEFTTWALIYQAEAGDGASLPLARTLAAGIVNPELQARAGLGLTAPDNVTQGGDMTRLGGHQDAGYGGDPRRDSRRQS